MKKLLGLTLGLSLVGIFTFGGIKTNAMVVRADDVESETSEIVVSEEDSEKKGFYYYVSQSGKDIIAILNQPIVIAGISTTIGALALLVIGKLIGNLKTKKSLAELTKLYAEIEKVSKKVDSKELTIVELESEIIVLKDILIEIASTLKNVKIKAEILSQLENYKPKVEKLVELAKNTQIKDIETLQEPIKQEIKQELDKTNDLLDILNK